MKVCLEMTVDACVGMAGYHVTYVALKTGALPQVEVDLRLRLVRVLRVRGG